MTVKRIFTLLVGLTFSQSALSENDRSGFGGHIGLFAGYTSSQSNLDTENPKTNGEAERSSMPLIGPPAELFYQWDSSRVYVSVFNGSSAFALGYEAEFGESAVSVSYSPELFGSEVFIDPYPLNTERKTTESKADTFDVEWDSVLGSPVSLGLSYYRLRIDNDKAGQASLNNIDQQLLLRDADSLIFNSSIDFPLSIEHKVFMTTQVSYQQYDAKGKAETFDGYGATLGVFKPMDDQFLLFAVGYQSNQYDTKHPIFNKVKEDDVLEASLLYTQEEPLGWQNTTLAVNITYSDLQSNIAFFNENQFVAGVGVIYNF
ncbi:hypothetical protein CS022_02430 [Veronia nyctiphanis]|uniref:DUF2860 domain-containing protein n=1 Tax=Veronia nyctiphanis TaxID=1278244 RepID=A0A4Q0YTB8_9GAMM|nr:DUF2860 family protein [Veronia nyctiphanis]RXJ74467.1 hypothetical protein CS022_02430 [Veronia nyctiphanis]